MWGPKTCLDFWRRAKYLAPAQILTPYPPARSPVSHYRLMYIITKYRTHRPLRIVYWRDNVFGFDGTRGVLLWKGDVTGRGDLERSGVTSLRDISIVGHVIRCYSDEIIWPLWVERPRRGIIWENIIYFISSIHHWGITFKIKRRYHVKHLYYRR
jgi:hypothetical protein